MSERGVLYLRIIAWVVAGFAAFFVFRDATDVDLRPLIAVAMVSGIIAALFPWGTV